MGRIARHVSILVLFMGLVAWKGASFNTMMIVPTGVGATIGGYAGDALPAARLLAEVSDTLITHPNVLNGAMLYWPMDNVLYVEGHALDEFAAGRLALEPLKEGSQRIGLLMDKGVEPDLRQRQLQVADGARATLGLDVHACVVTPREVGVELSLSESGVSWGSLSDIPALLEGAQELIDMGCTAIAVVARFPEEEDDEKSDALFDSYRRGDGVDAIAGAEALISHSITQKFYVPCAHAPAFDPMDVKYDVSPKAVAEELGYTFLPCVLANLQRSPRLHRINTAQAASASILPDDAITAADVDALVVPADCLGGPATLALLATDCLVVAVEDNTTAMKVSREAFPHANIVLVRSYLEAAGLVVAHKHTGARMLGGSVAALEAGGVRAAVKAGISVDAVRGTVEALHAKVK